MGLRASKKEQTRAATSPSPPSAIRTRIFPALLWPCYAVFVLAAIAWADTKGAEGSMRGLLALGSVLLVGLFERLIPPMTDNDFARNARRCMTSTT